MGGVSSVSSSRPSTVCFSRKSTVSSQFASALQQKKETLLHYNIQADLSLFDTLKLDRTTFLTRRFPRQLIPEESSVHLYYYHQQQLLQQNFPLAVFVEAFTETAKQLISFDCTSFDVIPGLIIALAVCDYKLPLQSLTLNFVDISDSFLDLFTNLIRTSNIKELNLRWKYPGFTDEGLIYILSRLSATLTKLKLVFKTNTNSNHHHGAMERLRVQNCGIQVIPAKLLKNCLYLEELHIERIPIKNSGCDLILGILYHQLTSLKLVCCLITKVNGKLLKKCSKLKVLDMSKNLLKDHGAHIILNNVDKKSVETIILAHCEITQVPRIQNLSSFEQLKELQLSTPRKYFQFFDQNQIDSVQLRDSIKFETFQQLVQEQGRKLERLHLVNLGIYKIDESLLGNCENLVNLDLSQNDIKTEGFYVILTALFRRIEIIILSGCSIAYFSDKEKQKLTHCLRLKELVLDENFVSEEEDVLILYGAIQLLPSLENFVPFSSRKATHKTLLQLQRIRNLLKSKKVKLRILLYSIRNFCRFKCPFACLPSEIVKQIDFLLLNARFD